jgi:phosphatidylinositol alpha-mannosyltransferase
VIGLARVLGRRGHQTTVFAPLDREEDTPDEVDLVSTGHSVSVPANGSVAPVTLSPLAVAQARRTLLSGEFDVVHIHEPFAPGLPTGLLIGGGRSPLVATFHRSGTDGLYTALRPLTRRLAARLRVCCAVSEAAGETARLALGVSCHVGFNGVDIDRFDEVKPWPADRPVVLFLGRHEERKGLGVLLEAFHRLGRTAAGPGVGPSSSGPGPVLWIAGDGPDTEHLRRQFPPSEQLEWLGVLSEEERDRRLLAADVLCAPSLGGESFGMVLLEAMATDTVVVASDIDGYRHAAGGRAVLVEPGDSQALAEALEGVLEGTAGVVAGDRDRWLDLAASRARSWSMHHLAEWYEGHYRTAMVGEAR